MSASRWCRAIAVLLGLSGGIVLASSKASLGDAPLGWILFTLSGPFIIAVGNLYRTMRWPQGVSPLYLASLMLLFAGLYALPTTLALEGSLDWAHVAVLPILLVQTLCFGLLYLLFFVLQKVAGPIYLSLIGSVAAVVGSLIARLWFGEILPANLALAALLIGAGLSCSSSGATKSVSTVAVHVQVKLRIQPLQRRCRLSISLRRAEPVSWRFALCHSLKEPARWPLPPHPRPSSP